MIPGAASSARRREVVSYDPRRGRMTAGQRRAWELWWPVYGRGVDELSVPLDAAAWFGRDAPLVLEIGSGMGESTVTLAAAEPETNHLAVEVYQPGLAHLLLLIRDTGVTNLRLLRGDAVAVLRELIAPGSLAGIRVFFPDPWPKQRHHKRRLVQPGFARLAATRLAADATLHLATDWADYATQMRDVCAAEPLLEPAGGGTGVVARPPGRPVTKFEQRAEAEGRTVTDLLYRRR